MTLPEPTRSRWQPLRLGVVDLFYYDVEEFHFHRGSLLFRGNNGTGKSKVLALTLPFLLDGELAPHRVEPDGDRNKRMEWNLLLGGKYPHPERLGYAWMEFGRRDADGGAQFVTVGCGLKAAAGRGIVKHWFFVTGQRVGAELSLLTPARTALTRERLKESLGERGMVYDRAGDYRRAVDEALFGLGSRYDALVSLLIQLRQPQLSKRPDERLLSHALTEALPPLDENLVTQAAEAFRSLDDEREALVGLRETKKAADDFLVTYRRYARVAAKRRATGPRQTQARYEQLGRDLAEAERARDEASAALESARERLTRLVAERDRLAAHEQALRESPESRAAASLEQAALRARELTEFAAAQRRALETARADAQRAADRLERARAAVDAAAAAVLAAREAAAAAAGEARMAEQHAADVDPEVDRDPGRGATAGETLAQWRSRSVHNLEVLLSAADRADETLRGARVLLDRATAELAAADGRVLAAEREVATRGSALVSATRHFLATARELRLPDSDDVLAALESWAETLDGDNPATSALTAAFQAAMAELTRIQAELESERRTTRQRRDEIDEEIRRLTAGGHHTPPVPYTRSPGSREQRLGAPLWRVVDFAPDVPAADRAGLEAALEAAGILDAWICPDGTVLEADTDDTLLRADTVVSVNLTRLLRPAVDPADQRAAALAAQTIDAVLTAIGLGPDSGATTWADPDGRFAVGVLSGRWRKEVAEHIGEGAREAARRARIAELRDESGRVAARLTSFDDALDGLRERQRLLAAEHADAPRDAPLREAHAVVRSEHEHRRRLADRRDEAEQEVRAAAEHAAQERQRAAEFATDVELPADRAALRTVTGAIGAYRVALAGLWPAVHTLATTRIRLSEAEPELDSAERRASEVADEHAEAERNAATARERHQVLADTVGTAVAELQRRLAETTDAKRRCERDERQTREAEGHAREARGRAEGRRHTLSGELDGAAAERDDAVEGLRHFAATGLLALACPEVEPPDPSSPWAATPAVHLARAVDRALTDVDDGDRRWELAQQSVNTGFKVLADGLSRHGHTAVMSVRDGTMLVDATFQGRTQPVAGLAEALEVEVAERQRVLSAHEREVLETHLVNEVAGTMQELISMAERQVADMNRELEDRPTSTGMRLRLVWRPAKDAPGGLAELRGKLLRQTSDVWNDDDRRRVGVFLQEQITAERLRDDAATWHEQLTRALDYRAWHEFAIERHQDGQWRSATGPASGGERVLAASIPLFAAASSYYSSAGNPQSPRLIALDEAFAGVDDDSRAKCLGLLAKFDLDVVMTSEREWGCYPEVPGLAIAQLARRDGIDAVLVTPWRWDGRGHRYQVPRPASHAAVAEPQTESLFT